MKKLLTIAAAICLTLPAVALASPDMEAIIQKEKSAWESIKDKKFDAFAKFLGPDFRGVYSTGIFSKEKELPEVRTLDFKSYAFGDMAVVFIGKDAVLLTYEVTIEGTAGGKDMSGKYNAASVWKKEGNDWQVSFHTDMKAESPGG